MRTTLERCGRRVLLVRNLLAAIYVEHNPAGTARPHAVLEVNCVSTYTTATQLCSFQTARHVWCAPQDDLTVHTALVRSVSKRLGCKPGALAATAMRLVRKSFDARRQKQFVYVVDVEAAEAVAAGATRVVLKQNFIEA